MVIILSHQIRKVNCKNIYTYVGTFYLEHRRSEDVISLRHTSVTATFYLTRTLLFVTCSVKALCLGRSLLFAREPTGDSLFPGSLVG